MTGGDVITDEVDVTVVVPVWNPGPYIEPCISSLLAQTHPAERLELVFVDDGATDETPARLDRLADEHPHVRVIHQENSGWPGKPRNVGTDEARGRYVFYVDQDDHLAPRTIERMLEVGGPNDADVIIGKVTSDFRGVPHGVFRTTRPRCTIHDAPLIDSLTPHKMFRRDFLRGAGIRYPEGRRRLEDQLFMVRSYFAADVVSIVGDYPCYFYKQRPDAKNAGSVAIEPAGYYANLREVLDVVVANTEPGEFRDLMLRRFYRVEMLGRLAEPSVLRYDDDYRDAILREVRALVGDYLGAGVTAGLAALPRARAALVEAGRSAELLDLAQRARPVAAWSSFDHLTSTDGRWVVTMAAELRDAEGQPLRILPTDGGLRLQGGGEHPLDLTLTAADVDGAYADVVLRERDTAVEWFVPHTLAAQVEPAADGDRLVFRGEAWLDPLTLAGGHPLPRGSWDVAVRIHTFGFVKRIRFGAVRGGHLDGAALVPVVTGEGLVVTPYFTDPHGNFSLDVGERRKPLAKELDRLPPVRAARSGADVECVLPLATPLGVDAQAAAWTVALGGATGELDRRPARLSAADGRLHVAFAAAAPGGARKGWIGLSSHPEAAARTVGTWRRRRGVLQVTVSRAARVQGASARNGTPRRRLLRKAAGRAIRRLRTR